MKTNEFLHKNHKKILTGNMAIIVVSLATLAISAGRTDKITALASQTIEDPSKFSFFSAYANYIFAFATLVFVLNLVSIALLFKVYKPEKFLIGVKSSKYNSQQKITKAFLQAVIETQANLTDKNYTLHLFKKIKTQGSKKNPSFKLISIKLEKDNFNVNIDSKIDSISGDQLNKTIQTIIDKLSVFKSDVKDPFKIALKSNMDLDLTSTLEGRGINLN